MTPRKKKTRRSPAYPPMRGAALGQLLTAFRVRNQALEEGGVRPGTAKVGITDQRDIGWANHVELLRVGVNLLSTREYLAAQGLDAVDATEHNELVVQAVDRVLTCWDQFAAHSNRAALPEPAQALVLSNLWHEAALSLVAYQCRYGRLHPVANELAGWMKTPNLAGWWCSVETRAVRDLKAAQFHRDKRGRLDPHTIRDLRDGKSLPQEDTVREVAKYVAQLHVLDRAASRMQPLAEIEFELRVAVAVAVFPAAATAFNALTADSMLSLEIALARATLARAPREVLIDVLRHGAKSKPVVERHGNAEARTRQVLADLIRNEHERVAHSMSDSPQKALQQHAADLAKRAEELRLLDPDPGADGPQVRLAEWLEHERDVALFAVGCGRTPLRPLRAELKAELEADGLCSEVVAPWLRLTPELVERKLREAVRIAPHLAYAHRSLANHLGSVGNATEALAHYRLAFELNPANLSGRESLALSLGSLGRYEEVIALCNVEWPSPVLESARAYCTLKLGEPVAAIELARAIVEKHPRHSMALRALAECERALGNVTEATNIERKAAFYERGVVQRA